MTLLVTSNRRCHQMPRSVSKPDSRNPAVLQFAYAVTRRNTFCLLPPSHLGNANRLTSKRWSLHRHISCLQCKFRLRKLFAGKTGNMEVRYASSDDVPSLAHLMTELGYPTSTEEMTSRMSLVSSRGDHATFVADGNGAIAGMICVSVSPSLYKSDLQGAIVALVVSSDFRGQGVGALLVKRGESWLGESGVKYVTVKPSIYRENAHRLYARLGYEHTGLRFSKNLILA